MLSLRGDLSSLRIWSLLHRAPCIPRRSSNAGSCSGWSCNPHPPSLPCTPAVSQKQMAGTLIKTPKSLNLSWTHMETMGNMMHTCNNCKEHTVWVRIGLANVVHRHHPNFYGFAAPETVAQVMASLIPRNVVNQTIANSLLNIVSYKIYILLNINY